MGDYRESSIAVRTQAGQHAAADTYPRALAAQAGYYAVYAGGRAEIGQDDGIVIKTKHCIFSLGGRAAVYSCREGYFLPAPPPRERPPPEDILPPPEGLEEPEGRELKPPEDLGLEGREPEGREELKPPPEGREPPKKPRRGLGTYAPP